MFNIFKLSLFVALMTVILHGPVWAHSVVVFAWVEGDTVYVEGKFGSGRRAVNSTVEVYDPQANLLLTGVTDENGEFSFRVPRKTEMKVVLLAGMGHRGEWTIPVSDLEKTGSVEKGEVTEARALSGLKAPRTGDVSEPAVPGVRQGPETATEISADAGAHGPSSEYVTAAEMQEAIEKALDKKMKPMMKLLVDAKQSGPSLTDILGGIGYIFGLAGVGAYVASRRKKL